MSVRDAVYLPWRFVPEKEEYFSLMFHGNIVSSCLLIVKTSTCQSTIFSILYEENDVIDNEYTFLSRLFKTIHLQF